MTSRDLASASAFVGDSSFSLLLTMCRLEPVNGWRLWTDGAGNRLRLHSNSKIAVYPAKEPSISTRDLYVKARPEVIERRCVWTLIIRGRDGRDFVFPVGKDGQLRLCCFADGRWTGNEMPLLAGIPLLRFTVGRYMSETEEVIVDPPPVSSHYGFDETLEAFTTKKPWLKNLTKSSSKAK